MIGTNSPVSDGTAARTGDVPGDVDQQVRTLVREQTEADERALTVPSFVITPTARVSPAPRFRFEVSGTGEPSGNADT